MLTDHTEISRTPATGGASDRRFGFVVGGILVAIAAVRSYIHGSVGYVGVAVAAAGFFLVVSAVIWPAILGPANKGWAMLGLALHKVTNPIVLGLIYVMAIIPTGLVMRVFRIDPLGLRSPKRDSYWSKRQAGSTKQSLERPF